MNYHRLRGLKEYLLIGSQFCRSEDWLWCGWVLCSGSQRLESTCHWLASLGVLFQACSGWQNFLPVILCFLADWLLGSRSQFFAMPTGLQSSYGEFPLCPFTLVLSMFGHEEPTPFRVQQLRSIHGRFPLDELSQLT